MQYCMPLPGTTCRAPSTLYQNLVTTRVSDDGFDRNRWDEFLYDSRLASALGEWPWVDVFMSFEIDNLLLATLSAGIVGVGDPIGQETRSALMQSVLPDGAIVKPDSPIVPLDQTYLGEAGGTMPPIVPARSRSTAPCVPRTYSPTHSEHNPPRLSRLHPQSWG